jgi:hypothetical protein
MSGTLADAVEDALPSDNELVIGVVTSGNPLTVTVRGGTPEGVGRLSTTGLAAGDNVALIREGATWLSLGKMIAGTATGLGLTGLSASAASSTLALTAVEQDIPGTTITFTTSSPSASVVAWWHADFETLVAATAVGTAMLRVDGVTAASPAAIYKQLTATERLVVGQATLLQVAPGTHTAVLRANRVGGADGQLRTNAGHTTLLLAVFE